MTRGQDITEAYESHHLFIEKAEAYPFHERIQQFF